MIQIKYCNACGQNIQPIKKFSIGWFLFSCLTIVGGGIYILYFLFFKNKVCPICCGNELEDKRDIKDFTPGEPGLSEKERKQKNLDTWVKKQEDGNAGIGDSWLAKMARANTETARIKAEKKKLKQDKKLAQ